MLKRLLKRLFGVDAVHPAVKKLDFTVCARSIMQIAYNEAVSRQQALIQPEHLLLGMLKEEGSTAFAILRELGLDVTQVENKLSTSRSKPSPSQAVKLSGDSQSILEIAVDEARRLNYSYVGTEHILLALLRPEYMLAARILYAAGIHYRIVRAQMPDRQ